MKKWLVLVWMLVPVALVSYHFGPGQKALAWREANAHRDTALEFEQAGHWEQAAEAYGQAINAVPTFADEASAATLARDQLRLAQINANFQLGRLDETLQDLRLFIDQVQRTHGADSSPALDARDLLGRVHFRAMVALRLESAEKSVWTKQWELARQNFRYLSEHSPGRRNQLDRLNLEAVIKSADLPVIALAAPSGGSGGAAGAAKATVTPPPPSGQPGAPGAPPPDARPKAGNPAFFEVPPPEFELGS